MSLFPAYSTEIINLNRDNINEESQETNEKLDWLKNSSYQQISACLHSTNNEISIESDSSDEEISEINNSNDGNKVILKEKHLETENNVHKKSDNKLLHKKKNKVKKKKSGLVQYETRVQGLYFEDKDRNKQFFTIDTLTGNLKPNYKQFSKRLGLNPRKRMKGEYFERYHVKNLDAPKKIEKKNTVIQREKRIEEDTDATDQTQNVQLQTEHKMIIEEFNKKLTNFPEDINTWLDYVLFQEKITQSLLFNFENKNLKQLINQKKLSIVEKGLATNQDSIELLKLKLNLESELFPADQFSDRIEAMVQKDPKNIILWETLIMTIKNSCTLCKVSRILDLYKKCFPILKKKSRSDAEHYDAQVLGMLYQCLIFLRHAGLWEQMWEIIRINLCLNLSLPHETLKNIDTIDEKTLMNMEELILNSKLPLNQLWLRIESLRESCHWTGIDINKVDISVIGDEKRLVSAEETNDYIYPTISRGSNFRLAILSILCLKVPLLPTRHSTMKDFNLEEHFWNVDSLEFILPMIYPTVWTGDLDDRLNNKTVIGDLLEGNLTSGPQFIKFHPAQELYLNFIRSVFSTIAQSLSSIQRTSIFVWWLRFERLLVFISKNDPLTESNRNKKLKSVIKNFLKKPENRNNLYFYQEYALIERELGSFDSCIQILKTIIQSKDPKYLNTEETIALMNLYRTIFEILLDVNSFKKSNLKIFEEMVECLEKFMVGSFNCSQYISSEEMLYNEILKFLMNPVTDEPEDAFLLPNIYCDILICYSYIVFMKNDKMETVTDILNLFDRCITHCNNYFHFKERLYETKVAFLQFCQYKSKKTNIYIMNSISEALEEFPSNFFLLSINALNEAELPYWKLKTSCKRLSIWTAFANCLAGRTRINYLKSIESEEAYGAMVNKMLSFHRTVSKIKETQSCPLIWKFYMLLLREHNLCQKNGEKIYYEAIAQCPWARSVYISAAEIAPQFLSQIQDLINEKELRMHVTPEELDILRE